MFKRSAVVIISALMILAMLSACAPAATPTTAPVPTQPPAAPAEPTAAPAQPTQAAPAPTEAVTAPTQPDVPQKSITIAVLAGGEVGDMGFIDSANEGLKRMEKELGLKTVIIQTRSDTSRYLDDLISAAQQADLIFVIPGYFFDEQLKQVVPQYPDKTFVYVDGETTIAGMTSVRFMENEGAFLAGALAALSTTENTALPQTDSAKTVGFMGGADMPVIHNYQVGFNQGAVYAVPDIKVINQYAGTHFDPAKGKETALAIYGQGADIIFQAAGPTGTGVFEAAKDAKKYVIGVDSNQKSLAPDYTLASMRKNVGDTIFQFTQDFLAGKITNGQVYRFGLAKGGVGIDYGGMDPDLVPQTIKDKIIEISKKIISGEIKVEEYTAPQ